MQMSEFGTGSELNMGSVGSVGGSRDQTWTSQGILFTSSVGFYEYCVTL